MHTSLFFRGLVVFFLLFVAVVTATAETRSIVIGPRAYDGAAQRERELAERRKAEEAAKRAEEQLREAQANDRYETLVRERTAKEAEERAASERKSAIDKEADRLRAAAASSGKKYGPNHNFHEDARVAVEARSRKPAMTEAEARYENLVQEREAREAEERRMANLPGTPAAPKGAILTRVVKPDGPTPEQRADARRAAAADAAKKAKDTATEEARLADGRAKAQAREDALRKSCMKPENRGACACIKFEPPGSRGGGCGK